MNIAQASGETWITTLLGMVQEGAPHLRVALSMSDDTLRPEAVTLAAWEDDVPDPEARTVTLTARVDSKGRPYLEIDGADELPPSAKRDGFQVVEGGGP